MAEGLAAVGLAGNIIQFISFASELVSKTRDIRQSASGVASEVIDLECVSNSLKSLTKSLLPQYNIPAQLYQIAVRCNDVTNELLEVIASLKTHSSPSAKGPTKWQSFRKALKCIWKKEQIDALKLRLQLLRDQVSLHLLSNAHKDQARVLDLLQTWKTHVSQATDTMTIQIRELDRRLKDIQQSPTRTFSDEDLTRLHEMCIKVRSDVQLLARRRAIIQSLRYECMEVRNETIKDAHKRTFDWMFAPNGSQRTTPRPLLGFAQWLQSGTDIYWVTGKPGSGKSTLMKYLFNSVETTMLLQAWAGMVPLVKASFYFWIPGQKMQKSLEGLLQTLLYHILSTCPDFVTILCPERAYQQDVETVSLPPWTLPELQKTFLRFQSQTEATAKFYFHIDGLDEYYGDTWDVIHTLQKLATCPNVKMCVSSRPWNSFQDAFGRTNPYVLRLHEWTKRDIRLFASESLMAYAAHSNFEPSLFQDLIQDIADRAQGVFLWVRLVVHSLRDGIVNDDPVSILHDRLRAIPIDLEDFFEYILRSVDKVYRSRMARTFLAASRTPRPLTTVNHYFLDQEDTVFDLETYEGPWPNSSIQAVVDQTHRRLNGRFKGLLEPSWSNAPAKDPKIDFLHRTLRDFLKTERMVGWLSMWASPESNVLLALGRAFLATQLVVDTHSKTEDLNTMRLVIELASLAIKETGDTKESHAAVDLAHDTYRRVRRSQLHTKCGVDCYVVHFALSVGLVDYLRHCVQKRGTKIELDHMLKHALCCPLTMFDTFLPHLPETSTLCTSQTPDHYESQDYPTKHFGHALSPLLITTLLDLGAKPNIIIESTSSWNFAVGEAVAQMDTPRREECLKVLEVFLKRCKNLDSSLFEWNSLLIRKESSTDEGMRNTLRYLEVLFSNGLSPNIVSQGTTLFSKFLVTLPNTTFRTYIGEKAAQHQQEILLMFLQAGGDVTQIYRDDSPEAWFPNFLLEVSLNFADQTKIAEYRIFLEHGLDPNAVLRGKITIWYRLLGVIYQRIQRGEHVPAQDRAIRQIVLLSLQHGADPDAPGLPRIFQWMKSRSCILTTKEVNEIEQLLPSSTLVGAGVVAAGGKRKSDDSRISYSTSGTKMSRRR